MICNKKINNKNFITCKTVKIAIITDRKLNKKPNDKIINTYDFF